MKENLAPTLTLQVADFSILWFESSNQYIVIDKGLYTLIRSFLDSKSDEDFAKAVIKLGHEVESANVLFKDISAFLEDCNTKTEVTPVSEKTFSDSYRSVTYTYVIDDKPVQVHYSSENIKSLIHPLLEHLIIHNNDNNYHCEFDLYEESGDYLLFKDKGLIGSWPAGDYHLMQGKFAMHLLCSIHNNDESDWLGTFHASTLVKNNNAVMIIGDSGKGKSTFTALLLANDFEVLADDLTPILAKDTLVYPYPGGISIKSGAFDILKSSLPKFDTLPQHYINPYKGYVKYVDAPKSKGYLTGYPCKIMVSINYQEKAATNLEPLKINEALLTLIPESWLAHDTYNAQQFLNWIKDVRFYQLTYSDSDEAIKVFSQLFKE